MTYRYSSSVSPAPSWSSCSSPIMVSSMSRQSKADNHWQPPEHAVAASAWFMKKYGCPSPKQNFVGKLPPSSGSESERPVLATAELITTKMIAPTETEHKLEERPVSRGRVLHQCSACKVLYTVSHFCPQKNNQQREGFISSRPSSPSYRPRSVEVSSRDSKKAKTNRYRDRPASGTRPKSSCRAERSRIYDPGPAPWAT
jgi:hypothetical protein